MSLEERGCWRDWTDRRASSFVRGWQPAAGDNLCLWPHRQRLQWCSPKDPRNASSPQQLGEARDRCSARAFPESMRLTSFQFTFIPVKLNLDSHPPELRETIFCCLKLLILRQFIITAASRNLCTPGSFLVDRPRRWWGWRLSWGRRTERNVHAQFLFPGVPIRCISILVHGTEWWKSREEDRDVFRINRSSWASSFPLIHGNS